MKLKNILALLLALILVLGLCVGCGDQTPDEPNNNNEDPSENAGSQEQQGGIPEKYQNLAYFDEEHSERYGGVLNFINGTADPHLDINAAGAATGTSYWARYVYETALAVGVDGKLYPLVCDFTYDEENKTWLELTVREGVTFHNGDPVEIEDVWASYNRNPKYQHIHEGITNTEIKDGVLHIDYDPAVGCVQALYWLGYHDTSFGIMPKEICDQWSGFESGVILDPQYVIGTGPYKIVPEEYVSMELIPLERYEGYLPCFEGDVLDYPNGRAAPRIAYLDEINVIINTDSNTTMMELLQGNADMIFSTAEIFQASLQPLGYQMYEDVSGAPLSDTPALFFNLHSQETAVGDGKASTSILANDVNLRKAICAAINLDEVMFSQYGEWWLQETSPVNCVGYSKAAFENAEYRNLNGDVAEAKAYLAQSNYKGETLVLRRPSASGGAMCQVVQKNCAAAGINVTIEPVDISAYQSDYRCGASGWDMYMLFGANTSSWPGFMPVNSYIPWGNERGAELREVLFAELNGTEASKEAWNELSQLMADECSYYVLGKSKGDRYVYAPGLNPNYTGYSCWYSAYWDDPSEHGG